MVRLPRDVMQIERHRQSGSRLHELFGDVTSELRRPEITSGIPESASGALRASVTTGRRSLRRQRTRAGTRPAARHSLPTAGLRTEAHMTCGSIH